MSAFGVVPEPAARQGFVQTGEMDTADGTHVVFGAERGRVLVLTDGGDIVLEADGQDLFARHLFRAMHATEVISAAEVPY